jgi:AraC-like DNA-binding protein
MIIPLESLSSKNFALSNINVIHRKPTYRFLNITHRKYNGLQLILHGECHYTFEGGEFTLGPGSVVYLPFGSIHQLDIPTDDFEFYRIDFQLEIDGELAYFSNKPLKLTDSASTECIESFQTLIDNYQFINDTVAKTKFLCSIFHSLQSSMSNPRCEKLAPAIRYLLEHLTEKINCVELAELCYLSTAQFYNLFHTEYGTTPLEYRNQLLLRKACSLLRESGISVTETSNMLGFESVAYFSRFFKKHLGLSPSNYLKQKD